MDAGSRRIRGAMLSFVPGSLGGNTCPLRVFRGGGVKWTKCGVLMKLLLKITLILNFKGLFSVLFVERKHP